jgi:hypothetical protein
MSAQDERCCFCLANASAGVHTPRKASWQRWFADGKTVWSWHPLLVSSRRRFCGPDRASRKTVNPRDDGGKTNSSPGSNCEVDQ